MTSFLYIIPLEWLLGKIKIPNNNNIFIEIFKNLGYMLIFDKYTYNINVIMKAQLEWLVGKIKISKNE